MVDGGKRRRENHHHDDAKPLSARNVVGKRRRMRDPRDDGHGFARGQTSNFAKRMRAPALTRMAVLACLCWPCVGGAGQPSAIRRAGPLARGFYLHQPTLGLRGAGAGGQQSDNSKSDEAAALLEVMACAGCSRKFAGDAYTLGCGHTVCEECHPATDSKGGIGEEWRQDEVEGCVLCGNSTGWIGTARVISFPLVCLAEH